MEREFFLGRLNLIVPKVMMIIMDVHPKAN